MDSKQIFLFSIYGSPSNLSDVVAALLGQAGVNGSCSIPYELCTTNDGNTALPTFCAVIIIVGNRNHLCNKIPKGAGNASKNSNLVRQLITAFSRSIWVVVARTVFFLRFLMRASREKTCLRTGISEISLVQIMQVQLGRRWSHFTAAPAGNPVTSLDQALKFSLRAFGSTSSLNDRLRLMRKNAYPDFQLSPQALLDCGSEAGTCDGSKEEEKRSVFYFPYFSN